LKETKTAASPCEESAMTAMGTSTILRATDTASTRFRADPRKLETTTIEPSTTRVSKSACRAAPPRKRRSTSLMVARSSVDTCDGVNAAKSPSKYTSREKSSSSCGGDVTVGPTSPLPLSLPLDANVVVATVVLASTPLPLPPSPDPLGGC